MSDGLKAVDDLEEYEEQPKTLCIDLTWYAVTKRKNNSKSTTKRMEERSIT